MKTFFASIALILNKIIYKKTLSLPKNLAGYELIKKITKKDDVKNFWLGIYIKKGKKYFIKIWQGKLKDLNYYSMLNEYRICQKMKRVPKAIDLITEGDATVAIFEYLEGKLSLLSIP